MPQRKDEESATIQIQYWWRKNRKRREHLIEKTKKIAEWRGLLDISLHNTELIQQLKTIRRRKAYDLMKYEHILQLPARKVNEFLAKEAEKPSKIVKEEGEEIVEGIEFEQKNKAARVIQRALAAYRAARERDAAAFAKRQLIIQSMKRNIAVLNSIKPGTSVTPSLLKCLGSTRPLSDYKASINHEEEMEKIEDSLLDLDI
uniref:Uncharacterized protein n=1 Tax=Angiostrongylus cantonensis TaxID=6313 RepID=A0A0K0DAQ0_ANGCA